MSTLENYQYFIKVNIYLAYLTSTAYMLDLEKISKLFLKMFV